MGITWHFTANSRSMYRAKPIPYTTSSRGSLYDSCAMAEIAPAW
jgi:hypothetical protein